MNAGSRREGGRGRSGHAQDSYDRAITTVCGAALGIAVGFIRGQPGSALKGALVLSWALFALSLVSVLASFD